MKPGIFKVKMVYALTDPAYILHDIQSDLAPLNGLNTTLYASKKMREFLGGSVPETWDAVKEWSIRHQPPLPHGLAEVSEVRGCPGVEDEREISKGDEAWVLEEDVSPEVRGRWVTRSGRWE